MKFNATKLFKESHSYYKFWRAFPIGFLVIMQILIYIFLLKVPMNVMGIFIIWLAAGYALGKKKTLFGLLDETAKEENDEIGEIKIANPK